VTHIFLAKKNGVWVAIFKIEFDTQKWFQLKLLWVAFAFTVEIHHNWFIIL